MYPKDDRGLMQVSQECRFGGLSVEPREMPSKDWRGIGGDWDWATARGSALQSTKELRVGSSVELRWTSVRSSPKVVPDPTVAGGWAAEATDASLTQAPGKSVVVIAVVGLAIEASAGLAAVVPESLLERGRKPLSGCQSQTKNRNEN